MIDKRELKSEANKVLYDSTLSAVDDFVTHSSCVWNHRLIQKAGAGELSF